MKRVAIEEVSNRIDLAPFEVSMTNKEFYQRYRVCSLAFVAANRDVDYVCGVSYFTSSVEFSFAYRADSQLPLDEPVCSFACQRR